MSPFAQLAADLEAKGSKEEQNVLFDEEVERFSRFMSTLGDWKGAGPLNRAEKALIKTYLLQKSRGAF